MKSVTIGNRVYMEMSRRECGEYFHKQLKHALKQSTEAHLRTGGSLRDTDSTYTLKGGIMEQVKKEENHNTYEPIDIFNKGE